LDGVCIAPTPVQDPYDVWLGGIAPSELRRVGRLGDGWLPSFVSPDDAAAARPAVEEAAAAAGRHLDDEHWGALVLYAPDGVPDVLIVVFDGFQPLDATGPYEVFRGAGYDVRLASPDGAAVRSTGGLAVGVDVALSRVRGPIDTLLVAGGAAARAEVPDARVV